MARKKIKEVIQIPEGVNVEIDGSLIKLSHGGNAVEKKLAFNAKKEGDKIILEHEKPTKNIKKLMKSSAAHVRNMIAGLANKYVYKLQICAVHFPITVSIKGNEFVIKNFLGEVKERKAKIVHGAHVKVDKEIITVESHDKEKAGQTAANIESATRITNRDRRIFQDGIYITEKQKGVKK